MCVPSVLAATMFVITIDHAHCDLIFIFVLTSACKWKHYYRGSSTARIIRWQRKISCIVWSKHCKQTVYVTLPNENGIFMWKYYNKNKWVLWSICGDHVNCFCVEIFHESAGRVKYSYQKQWTWSPPMITTNLFLFLCRTIIDWILILMVYVYNFKKFTGETAIS